MSEYNTRRFPNFSQYLDDLNTIPSPYDQALQQQQQQDSFNIDDELALFTNAEFFDFDHFGELSLPTFDSVDNANEKKEPAKNVDQKPDIEFTDLLNNGLGNMNGFSSNFNAADAQPMPMQNTSFSAIPPFPAAPADSNPAPSQQPSATALTSVDASPSSKPSTTPKRKQAQKSGPRSVEEESRITAEEDKRRRNTAASARFRVKKKLREQTLEKTVKDTTSRNTALEARVSQLELENQWLKNLITEKNDGNSGERKSENDIAEMFKKFLASQKPEGERSLESKNGVGTSA